MAVPLFVLANERKIFKRRKGLEDLTDFEIRQHTGFPSWAVRELIELFEPISGQNALSIPVETKVLCYLCHLRSGSFQYALGSLSGIAQSSVSRIIEECLNYTLTLTPNVIKFPGTVEDLVTTKQRFAEVAAFPNVLGVIDGTQIAIKAPAENEAIFVCRKQFHSINAQVICGADYTFFDVVAKWPGSTHDSYIYNNSAIKSRLLSGEFGEGWLLGDSGYPLEPRLLTPYTQEVSEAQRIFNVRHKSTRTIVERSIGILKSRLRSIDRTGGSLCYTPTKCCKIITAACTIHNICITRAIPLTEEDNNYFNDIVLPNIQAERVRYQQNAQRREAALIRDRLADSFL